MKVKAHPVAMVELAQPLLGYINSQSLLLQCPLKTDSVNI